MNAVAGDIIQPADKQPTYNYEVGGINHVSTYVLHEQMGDEWGEAETEEVAHVVIRWATNLLWRTCGNSMVCKSNKPTACLNSLLKASTDAMLR